MKFNKRVQEPHDKNINPEFNEWVKRSIEDVPLIDMADSDEDHPLGIEIDNEPTPSPPEKVTLSNFLARPGELGNQSGDESDFDEFGTHILVKEEKQAYDSEAEGGYCHPNDRDQKPKTCSVSTQVDTSELTSDTGMGTSESSSEDEAEPPHKEAAKTARKLVVFNATQTLMENPETATAFFQALIKNKF